AEDEKRRAIRNQTSEERHPVARGAHSVLANPEVEVSPLEVPSLDAARAFDQRLRGRRQVRRPTYERRDELGRHLLDHVRGVARRVFLLRYGRDELLVDVVRNRFGEEEVALLGQIGVLFLPRGQVLLPRGALLAIVFRARLEQRQDLRRDDEVLLGIP